MSASGPPAANDGATLVSGGRGCADAPPATVAGAVVDVGGFFRFNCDAVDAAAVAAPRVF